MNIFEFLSLILVTGAITIISFMAIVAKYGLLIEDKRSKNGEKKDIKNVKKY